jgi:hypothetical protein
MPGDTINDLMFDRFQKMTFEDGKLYISNFKEYEFSDKQGTDPLYIGYLAKDGRWFIKKYSAATGEMRFCKGDSDYSTNFTNRESLTYDYFSEVF